MTELEYQMMDTVVANAIGYLMQKGVDNQDIYFEKIDLNDKKQLCMAYLGSVSAALSGKHFGIELSLLNYWKFKRFFGKRIIFTRKLSCEKLSYNSIIAEIEEKCYTIINEWKKDHNQDIFEVIYEEYYAPKENSN